MPLYLCGLAVEGGSLKFLKGDLKNEDFIYMQEIRGQFNEQLKALEFRTETQQAIFGEIQDYYRRRAEVELEYSRNLDKLAKQTLTKHKAEKSKRESWTQHGLVGLWQELVESSRLEARDRAALSDLYSAHLLPKLANQSEDISRIARKCRDAGVSAHAEISRVLSELHTAMKTYQLCFSEAAAAEAKFRATEAQKLKFEAENPAKVGASRKHKFLEKEYEKKQGKYFEMRMKGLKARNEYLLCIDAANAALHKYFADDLSDIIDASDLGLQQWLSSLLATLMAARKALTESESEALARIRDFAETFDSRSDKQKFIEANTNNFMLPRKFEFRPQGEDQMRQVSAQKPIQDELLQRLAQMERRLGDLRTETEEVWKTLETAESRVLQLQQAPVVCVADIFTMGTKSGSGMSQTSPYASSLATNGVTAAESKRSICREPEIAQQKRKHDLAETEDFYMQKLEQYLLTGNLITRLTARAEAIKGALGGATDWTTDAPRPNRLAFRRSESVESDGAGTPQSSAGSEAEPFAARPPSLPPKPRKKRIGGLGRNGEKAPKLFGGSLEEYVEATGEEIPTVVRACVRLLSHHALHHQGVFRVSGSQLEIAALKEAFERGEDPLMDAEDSNEVNSAAGCLKAYFRELREPLFPIYLFDSFTDCTQCNRREFLSRFKDLLATLPRSSILVLRYLFAFLNHLSEFSDENMMDPYNLAICFGPTLMPIPEGKDQVLYHNHVNELMRTLIMNWEDLFPNIAGPVYHKFAVQSENSHDDDALPPVMMMSMGDDDGRRSVDDAAPHEYDELLPAASVVDQRRSASRHEEEPVVASLSSFAPKAPPSPAPAARRVSREREEAQTFPIGLELERVEPPYEIWHKRTSMKKPEAVQHGSPSGKSSVKLSLHKVAPAAPEHWSEDVLSVEAHQPSPTPPARHRNGSSGSVGREGGKRLSLQAQSGLASPANRHSAMTASTHGDMDAGPLGSLTEIQSELKAVLSSLETFSSSAGEGKEDSDVPDLVQNLPSNGSGVSPKAQPEPSPPLSQSRFHFDDGAKRAAFVKTKSPAPKPPPIARKPLAPPVPTLPLVQKL